jgi:hypothetical protein
VDDLLLSNTRRIDITFPGLRKIAKQINKQLETTKSLFEIGEFLVKVQNKRGKA